MSSEKRPLDTNLAMRTAEALAIPHIACRRRSCRRGQRCRWYFSVTGEPCCLDNLDSDERAKFDEIYQAAHFAKGFLGSDGAFFNTTSGQQRLLDDLAIAIARNVPNRWMAKQWDAARRAREKRMAAADRQAGADG